MIANLLWGPTMLTRRVSYLSKYARDSSLSKQLLTLKTPFSSNEDKTGQDDGVFSAFSSSIGMTNLGLCGFISPHLSTVRQLPEINLAITSPSTAVEPLKRGAEIFSAIKKGSNEHKAVLAILAEVYQRTENYASAASVLSELGEYCDKESASKVEVDLARSKALWFNGDFSDALEICDRLVEYDDDISPIHYASCRNGQAIARLSATNTLDEAFSVRDPARMVVKFLEGSTEVLAFALAHLNYGLTEAIYGEIISRENQVDVPLDPAMRAWKEGLTQLKRFSPKEPHEKALKTVLEARLLTNMAWGLLEMSTNESSVKEASEYARRALDCYDHLPEYIEKEGIGRTLSLIAACYHKTSRAVTAEGLYQSALDSPSSSSLGKLEQISTYNSYAKLCHDWERREKEGDRLLEKAKQTTQQLPDGWKGKSVLHSSLWFWTPALLSG